MSEEFIEEDWEHLSRREKAEIAAEIEALMQEEWWLFCEQQEQQERLPAEVKIKNKKKNETSRISKED